MTTPNHDTLMKEEAGVKKELHVSQTPQWATYKVEYSDSRMDARIVESAELGVHDDRFRAIDRACAAILEKRNKLLAVAPAIVPDCCALCRFWDMGNGPRCRRFPPVIADGDFMYPVVMKHDWCGEFKKAGSP